MTDRDGQVAGVLDFDIVVSRLPKSGLQTTYEASPQECAELAGALGVLRVASLSAELLVTSWRRDGVLVKGRLRAVIAQASVVTLDPVEEVLDEPVHTVFIPDGSRIQRVESASDGELHLDPEGDDIPETFTGDRIDLGTHLQELIALAMEPYPREADALFDEFDTDPNPEVERPSPFAGLEKLRGGRSEPEN